MKQSTFIWENFKQHPPHIQDELLKAFDGELESMTAGDYVDAHIGAPVEIVLRGMILADPDIQVALWRKALPVTARAKARKLLKLEAMQKLGLTKKGKWCLA